MRVIEAEGKAMLARRGIATPAPSRLCLPDDLVDPSTVPVAVKAQTLAGKRAQSGLVRLTPGEQAPEVVARIREEMVRIGEAPIVLVEPQVEIEREYYLAWRIDDLQRKYVLMFSAAGGANIEERGHTVHQYFHSPLEELQPYDLAKTLATAGLPPAHIGAVSRFAVTLFKAFCDEEATLLEINPLVVTKQGQVVAVDAKLVLDDNAEKRHLDWSSLISASLQARQRTPLEAVAAEAGFTFVELDGSVAVFSAGAGLGMCVLDMLADAGLFAANFSDTSGGSSPEVFARMGQVVFQLAQRPHVKAIVFFFVLSATSLKSIVDGILHLVRTTQPPKPLVVGLIAAGAAERELSLADAQKLIREAGCECVTDLAEALEVVRRLAAGSAALRPGTVRAPFEGQPG
jgi:succinyl-CoA synthetase beta subunit